MQRQSRILAASGLMALLMTGTGCNDTSFKSETPRKEESATVRKPEKPKKQSDATFKLECKDGKGEAKLVTELKGTEGTTVKLEGEFCGIPTGTSTGNLTVLFLLDFSGSMRDNDPLVAGRCGRLDASEAIVAKLEADLQDGVELKIGMLPFGSSALPIIATQPLASFKAAMTAATVCRNDGRETNYEAAFVGATKALKDVQGTKVVYFVSDGLPTVSGTGLFGGIGATDAQVLDAGRKAAAALRAIPDLTLNTIFLGNIAGIPGGDTTFNPQTYLEDITGNKDHVRLATNAADLAAEIVKFDTPEAVSLDAASVNGTVTASAFGKNDIKLESLKQDPSREGVWIFVTKPFTLFANKAKPVTNDVTFTVKGGDGKDYKATATITFEMDAE